MRVTADLPDSGLDMNGSVGLLITLLVRYPEIGNVKLEQERETIKLTFVIAGRVEAEDAQRYGASLEESLHTYASLVGYQPSTVELEVAAVENLTLLEVRRDLITLTRGEVNLLVSLTKEAFDSRLLIEPHDLLSLDDQMYQDELIENMLADLREKPKGKGLIGFREGGKVLVFNQGNRLHGRKS